MTPWQVLSTAHRHLCDLDPLPTSPEQAVRAACLWNLDADGGFWFGGGVATVEVQSPAGERWTCSAEIVKGPGRVNLSPLVRLQPVGVS
jgi:hypothetical protein